jgi:hypothetical protein
LLPTGVVTTTLAAPAAPAGVVAVMVVALTTVTPVAAVPPKVTLVAPVKPVPRMITLVPPAMGPEFGLTEVTVGNWSIDNVNAFVTEFGTPSVVVSVTAMLKLYIPGVVGVPLKTPPDRLNPGGKDPEAREKA